MNEVELHKAEIKGRIQGLNTARIRIWGISYDNDETAQMMRKFLSDEIVKLQEMLDIDNFNHDCPDGKKEETR